MGYAVVVCKKCGILVKLGEQRLATNKKFYCKVCYKEVEEGSAARLVKIAESLPTTEELRGGKDIKDVAKVKSVKDRRKKTKPSGDSED